MVFFLDSGIGQMLNLDGNAKLLSGVSDQICQFRNLKNFRELIKHTVFALSSRIINGQRYALKRIADVQKASLLLSFSIDSQRKAGNGFHAEPVEHGSKRLVVVEAGPE